MYLNDLSTSFWNDYKQGDKKENSRKNSQLIILQAVVNVEMKLEKNTY